MAGLVSGRYSPLAAGPVPAILDMTFTAFLLVGLRC